MIKVDDLITWARNNAYGRSASLPCGWIMSEQLQSLVYEMKKVDPLNYDPKVKAEQTEPRKTTDYCDICNHERCENCIADGTNPYCVPSNYEQTERSE